MSDTPETGTPDVPVFFASTEGQTRKIAERLAVVLRGEGFDSRPVLLGGPGTDALDWNRVRGAIVGGSLHIGTHQPAVAAFVGSHVQQLNARPTAFFSVSLSAASKNASERDAAQRLADALPKAAGWTPLRTVSLAGRLAYTQYGFFKRLALKRIARKEGAPTDTSRDYEFTDWNAVERLARDVSAAIREGDGGRTASTQSGVPAA
jgi:menaquinone-dependent protoporphyrinogen oxidase